MTAAQKDTALTVTCIAVALLALMMLAGWFRLIPYFDGSEAQCAFDPKCSQYLQLDTEFDIEVQRRIPKHKVEPMT